MHETYGCGSYWPTRMPSREETEEQARLGRPAHWGAHLGLLLHALLTQWADPQVDDVDWSP